MLTLDYTLTVGRKAYGAQLLRLICKRGLAPDVGVLRAWLPHGMNVDGATGTPVHLRLDSGDAEALVFTGTATRLVSGPRGVELRAGDAAQRLAARRPGTTYVAQRASEVITDLCRQGGVDDTEVDSGPLLPLYVADGGSTAWEHIGRLAAWYGADAGVDADDRVTVRIGQPVMADHALRWGREVLDLRVVSAASAPAAVRVAGGGPGPADARPGALGFSAAEPAGAGDPAFTRSRPALRDTSAVTQATAAWTRHEAARRRGIRLRTFLLPQLQPGGYLEIQDSPVEVPLLQVRRLEHRVDARGALTYVDALPASADLPGLDAIIGLAGGLVAGALP